MEPQMNEDKREYKMRSGLVKQPRVRGVATYVGYV